MSIDSRMGQVGLEPRLQHVAGQREHHAGLAILAVRTNA